MVSSGGAEAVFLILAGFLMSLAVDWARIVSVGATELSSTSSHHDLREAGLET